MNILCQGGQSRPVAHVGTGTAPRMGYEFISRKNTYALHCMSGLRLGGRRCGMVQE